MNNAGIISEKDLAAGDRVEIWREDEHDDHPLVRGVVCDIGERGRTLDGRPIYWATVAWDDGTRMSERVETLRPEGTFGAAL